MRRRPGRMGRTAAVGLLVTGCFLPATVLRAANADPGHAADKTAADAAAAGTGNYFDGLRVGAAQGRLEGRALQIGDTVPPGSRHAVEDAFKAGYAAGANDAVAGDQDRQGVAVAGDADRTGRVGVTQGRGDLPVRVHLSVRDGRDRAPHGALERRAGLDR